MSKTLFTLKNTRPSQKLENSLEIFVEKKSFQLVLVTM